MSGCACVPCSMCQGEGTQAVDMYGHVVDFFDDLCDLEACEYCGGSGIYEECDYCCAAREADEFGSWSKR